MIARDIMTKEGLVTCQETAPCSEVSRMMLQSNVGSVIIVDDQMHPTGIVTDRDLCLRILAEGRSINSPVGQIMTREVRTASPRSDLREITSFMKEYQVRRLPVVDDERKLVGIVSLSNLARHCHGFLRDHTVASVLEAVSTPIEELASTW